MRFLREYIRKIDANDGIPTAAIVSDILADSKAFLAGVQRDFDWYDGPGDPIIADNGFLPKQTDIIDNRINVAFPARIVDTKVGYLFGQPQRVTLEGKMPARKPIMSRIKAMFGAKPDPVEMIDRYTQADRDLIDRLRIDNDMSDLDAETGRFAAAAGYCGRLLGKSETKNPATGDTVSAIEALLIEPWLCLFLTDGEIYNPRYSLRIWEETRDRVKYCVVRFYTPTHVFVFEQGCNGGSVTPVGEPEAHLFGGVPLIGYPNNRELRPDFWHGKKKIFAYEKRVSAFDSELEGEREGYTVFQDCEVSEDARKESRKTGGIAVKSAPGTNGKTPLIYRIEKNLHPEAHVIHIDRLSQDINLDCGHVDWTDEKFGGNLSGIAIKYKILPLENKCIVAQEKHVAADRQMYWLACNFWAVKGSKIDYRDIKSVWTRSLPPNIAEEVDMVAKAKGVVSDLTAYSLGKSFISDPEREKEQFDNENPTVNLGGFSEEETDQPEADDETPGPALPGSGAAA